VSDFCPCHDCEAGPGCLESVNRECKTYWRWIETMLHKGTGARLKSELACGLVLAELDRATAKYPKFTTTHHGYGILKEEVDELWEEIKADKNGYRCTDAMRREAVKVAAMAIRFILDLGECDGH